MDTNQIEYYYSGEYATKSPLVLTEENKDQVEIYDCHENYSINVSEKTIQELAKILADIAANWREITEEEYNQITNS